VDVVSLYLVDVVSLYKTPVRCKKLSAKIGNIVIRGAMHFAQSASGDNTVATVQRCERHPQSMKKSDKPITFQHSAD
jgi:hypothetical protein